LVSRLLPCFLLGLGADCFAGLNLNEALVACFKFFFDIAIFLKRIRKSKFKKVPSVGKNLSESAKFDF
jgi:cadmium resistance protein CadD (predicted permease)